MTQANQLNHNLPSSSLIHEVFGGASVMVTDSATCLKAVKRYTESQLTFSELLKNLSVYIRLYPHFSLRGRRGSAAFGGRTSGHTRQYIAPHDVEGLSMPPCTTQFIPALREIILSRWNAFDVPCIYRTHSVSTSQITRYLPSKWTIYLLSSNEQLNHNYLVATTQWRTSCDEEEYTKLLIGYIRSRRVSIIHQFS